LIFIIQLLIEINRYCLLDGVSPPNPLDLDESDGVVLQIADPADIEIEPAIVEIGAADAEAAEAGIVIVTLTIINYFKSCYHLLANQIIIMTIKQLMHLYLNIFFLLR